MKQTHIGSDFDDFLAQDNLLAECEAGVPKRAVTWQIAEEMKHRRISRAKLANSDYQSVNEAMAAIDRHFVERNQAFKANPKEAGGKIWGEEIVAPKFSEANNCKDKRYMNPKS